MSEPKAHRGVNKKEKRNISKDNDTRRKKKFKSQISPHEQYNLGMKYKNDSDNCLNNALLAYDCFFEAANKKHIQARLELVDIHFQNQFKKQYVLEKLNETLGKLWKNAPLEICAEIYSYTDNFVHSKQLIFCQSQNTLNDNCEACKAKKTGANSILNATKLPVIVTAFFGRNLRHSKECQYTPPVTFTSK